MKWKQSNGDAKKALSLSTEQVQRVDNAIETAINTIQDNKNTDWSIDEIITIAAPHIHTPEEAFYAGLQCMAWVDILIKKGYIA